MIKSVRVMKWVIWTLGGVLYLYEYFIRVAPSVMVPELMQAFSVNATAIGSLSAFFFYIYAPMQLPVGLMVDRYGARKLLTFSGIAAGLGTLLFGLSTAYWVAATGRFLMGAGSSFGFVGMVYICSHWFEESKRGVMIGLANGIGMVGAILGQGPLRIGLNLLGWRLTFVVLAIFGILLGVILYILVRDDPKNHAHTSQCSVHEEGRHFGETLLTVCKSGQTWISSVCALFFYVSTATFAGLWGIPFIEATYNLPTKTAGFAISMIFVGWAIGGPLIGIYSDRIRQKKSIIAFGTLVGFLLMCTVVYVPLTIFLLFLLLLIIGIVSSAQLLGFSYAIDVNPPSAKGTATAFVNFIVVLGTACMQPFIGYLLDLNWTGKIVNGAHAYTPYAYKVAMTCFPLSFLLAFIISLFLKQNPQPKTQ